MLGATVTPSNRKLKWRNQFKELLYLSLNHQFPKNANSICRAFICMFCFSVFFLCSAWAFDLWNFFPSTDLNQTFYTPEAQFVSLALFECLHGADFIRRHKHQEQGTSSLIALEINAISCFIKQFLHIYSAQIQFNIKKAPAEAYESPFSSESTSTEW